MRLCYPWQPGRFSAAEKAPNTIASYLHISSTDQPTKNLRPVSCLVPRNRSLPFFSTYFLNLYSVTVGRLEQAVIHKKIICRVAFAYRRQVQFCFHMRNNIGVNFSQSCDPITPSKENFFYYKGSFANE